MNLKEKIKIYKLKQKIINKINKNMGWFPNKLIDIKSIKLREEGHYTAILIFDKRRDTLISVYKELGNESYNEFKKYDELTKQNKKI